MSRSIDERIVEMKFDNKQFEGGIKESLNSLQKLENALNKNISAESIENISRAAERVDLSGISAGIEALNNKFSTLGIVGITVIQNITNALLNGLGKAVSSVTDSIVSGGIKRAMNIENAHFQLQGLISDEKEVQKIMKQASDSVDGTAYSYDAAAKAASMFAASGLRAGTEMEQALKGISGVAATTNSDYEGVSRIFTTVAGQGRLMGDQLLQLSSRGMNAAAALKNFFNGVSDGSIQASEGVAEAVKELTGASNTFKGTAEEYKTSIEDAYEAASKAYQRAYKERQTILNSEYKDLQKTLSKEYDARKKAYDAEYDALKKNLDAEYKAKQKAFDEEYTALKKSLDAEYETKKETFDKEYQALSKSLDEEIKAQQKANSERLKEAEKAYQEDVASFRKATEEKISLIDKEYSESLKLIDEEAYKKTKALEDQITAIEKAAEAEEKERKLAERNNKLAELQNAVDSATSAEAREKAAASLLEYQQKVAQEELAEQRKTQKAKLKEEIAAIKEEASVKKQAAKDKRDAAVESAQDEANATLEAKADTYAKEKEALQEQLQEELEALRESKAQKLSDLKASQNEELEALRESQSAQLEALKEQQSAQLEAIKEGHNSQLSSLKESQNNELEIFKEGQNAQLEALKEKQSEQLEALKEANNEKLKALKEENTEALKSFSAFQSEMGVTEADIRDMVSKGLISFDMFAEAMAYTFGDHAKDANKTFTGSLANIGAALARTGALFVQPLIEQGGAFVRLFNAIRVKINDFNKALGATNGLAKRFTDWVKKIVNYAADLVEGFKIANTYTLKFGTDVEKVIESTDYVIQKFGDGTERLVKKKVYTPFHALQDIILSVKNVIFGLVDVLKPVASAFADVFLTVDKAQGFFKFVEHVRKLTDNLRLSQEQSDKLKTAFTGIFKAIDSVLGVFGRLFTAITGSTKETKSFGDVIIDLISAVGEVANKFADWIDNSETLQNVINAVGGAIASLLSFITSDKTKLLDDFVQSFKDLTGIDLNKVAESIGNAASSIGKFLTSGFTGGIDINSIIESAKNIGKNFLDSIKEFFGIHSPSTEMEEVGGNVIQGFINGITKGFKDVTDSAKGLLDSFWEGLGQSTKGNEAANSLEEDQNRINPVLDWIQNKLIPTLSENKGSMIALAGTGGLMYVLMVLASSIKKVTKAIDVLGSIKSVANAWATDLKAEAFKHVVTSLAIAMGILTLCLIGLSKVPAKDLAKSVGALILVMHSLAALAALIVVVMNKLKTVESAMSQAAIGVKRGVARLGTAAKIGAAGFAIKKFAEAITLIIIDIAAIMLIYNRDKEGFNHAITIVGVISAALLMAMATLVALGQKMEKGSTSFLKVTVGVLALSAAMLLIISAIKNILKIQFDPKEDAKKLILFAAVFAAVGTLALAIGKASGMAGFGSLKAAPILAMCLLISSCVSALKKVLDLNVKGREWIAKLGIFTLLFGALETLVIAIGLAARASGGEGLKGAATILSLCAFIAVAVAAIAVLGELRVTQLLKGALGLGSILICVAVVFSTASKLILLDEAQTVLTLVAMIGIIAGSLAALSFIEVDKLLASALGLGGVILCMAVVFKSAAAVADTKPWKNVIIMVAVLAPIVAALKVLGTVDSWETLISAAASIGILLGSIATFLSKMSKIKVPDIDHIGSVLGALLACAAIASILNLVANLPWEGLLAGAESISTMLLAIATSIKILSTVKDIKADKAVAVAGGLLACWVISLILRQMSDMDWQTMIGAATSISELLLAISATFAVLNGVGTIKYDKAIAVAGGCIAVGIIGFILSKFVNDQPWSSMISMGTAISEVLIAMAVAIGIMSGIKNINIVSIGAFVACVWAVKGVGEAIAECATMSWQSMLATGVSISIVILAMSVAMMLLAGVGTLQEAAFIGIAALDAFIGSLAQVMSGLALLSEIKVGGESILDKGAQKLILLGQTLGEFVACIIEGIGEGVGRALEAIGESLSQFMENAKPFFDGLKGMDQDTVKAATSLAGVVLALSAAEFLDGVTNLLRAFTGTEDVSSFGQKLVQFGKSMSKFDEETKDVDAKHVSYVAKAAIALIKIAKEIPNSGGLAGLFAGNNDIDVFGDRLAKFAKHMKVFDKQVKEITDITGWKMLANGTKYFVKIASEIPNEGGIISWFAGDNNIDKFAMHLTGYATHMKLFHAQVAEITDITGWKQLAKGTKYFIDIASQIPNEGGILSWFTGDNDIGKFAMRLTNYATHMKLFHKQVSEITDTVGWKQLAVGTKQFIDIATQIPNSGGILSWFTGDNDIGKFGSSLNTYAYWMKSFNIYVKDFSASKALEVANGTKYLISMIKSANELDNKDTKNANNFAELLAKIAKTGLNNFISVFENDTPIAIDKIKKFFLAIYTIAKKEAEGGASTVPDGFYQLAKKSVVQYIKGITDNTQNATKSVQTFMQKLIDTVKANNNTWKLLGTDHVKLYLAAISTLYETAKVAGREFSERVVAGIKETAESYQNVGTALANKFIEEFKEKGKSEGHSAAVDIIDKIIDSIREEHDRFKDAGQYLAEGLRDGINDKIGDVADKAREMAREARRAVEDEFQEQSPSKVMKKDGEYFGEGLALGILNKVKRVKQAAIEMAKTPVGIVESALDEIPELDPTITPIVDLTNVMDAADTINGLFNDALSNIGVNVTKASSSMSAKQKSNNQQNIQNDSGSGETKVSFVQNNYSPKALSRIDIYRDTRNQLAQFREAVART